MASAKPVQRITSVMASMILNAGGLFQVNDHHREKVKRKDW
jgi:hypothetical protein